MKSPEMVLSNVITKPINLTGDPIFFIFQPLKVVSLMLLSMVNDYNSPQSRRGRKENRYFSFC